ncbi:unnamed protein product [Boreogadus saida]
MLPLVRIIQQSNVKRAVVHADDLWKATPRLAGLCSANPFQLFNIIITLNTGQPALMVTFKVVMEPAPVLPVSLLCPGSSPAT